MKNKKTLPTLVITGPVGAGKTTVGYKIGDLLVEDEQPFAIVDMDAIRTCHRAADAPYDYFNMQLGLRNLASIVPNYQALGVERLILMDIVETLDDKDSYQRTVHHLDVQVVRLSATLETCHRRLERRETGDDLIWHKNRAAELIALMDKEQLEDILVVADDRTVEDIAHEILTHAGWL